MGADPKFTAAKKCSWCGIKKPGSEFYKKGKRLDSECKRCKKDKRNNRYKFHLTEKDISDFHAVANKILEYQLGVLKAYNSNLKNLLQVAEERKTKGVQFDTQHSCTIQ